MQNVYWPTYTADYSVQIKEAYNSALSGIIQYFLKELYAKLNNLIDVFNSFSLQKLTKNENKRT